MTIDKTLTLNELEILCPQTTETADASLAWKRRRVRNDDLAFSLAFNFDFDFEFNFEFGCDG
jgi:hypothetical protein